VIRIPVLRLPVPVNRPAPLPASFPASPPAEIRIPAIGVNAPVTRVGLTRAGALNVPPVHNANLAGWYQYGPAPGQPGAAVIVGHYDTYVGPAVFYRLSQLHRGEKIWIRLADRRTVVFAVRSADRYPKSDFPTGKVYVNGGPPTLRLITCAGAFDWATRHYIDDRVVYATYVRSWRPPHPAKRSHRRQHPRRVAIRPRPKNRK
jgi:sortase (surface protein transpeptidase)